MELGRPWAQCVVVRGQMITYVDAEARAASFTDAGTEVIEVDGHGAPRSVPVKLTMMDGRITHDTR
jgi:predicted amidohydrolase YtcJ